jgi:hypothetical protein
MQGASSFETSDLTRAARRRIPEDGILQVLDEDLRLGS